MLISPESLAVLGGAIALAGGLLGSSIGIAQAASAGVAVLADDPKQLRNVIVLAALPMTQTFYGLIILIIIVTTAMPIVVDEPRLGFAVLAVGIIAAAAQAFSAVYQGLVCASGISLLPKTKGRILTNAMMLAVFVELLGVLGLVFSILALTLIGAM
ncbi:MAG: V-type sodium ATPase subunit K [Dehalococcoidia bacterium]|nr:V-type sodium ATPase subunit K [Bacillota bacterium]MBT9143324.1 V-type sodium ATPase subunit K [Bacillota bacterium]